MLHTYFSRCYGAIAIYCSILICPQLLWAQENCSQIFRRRVQRVMVDPQTQYEKALGAASQGRWSDAVQWSLPVLKLAPDHLENLLLLAGSLGELGQTRQAQMVYERLSRYDDFSQSALHNRLLIEVYERNGEHRKRVDGLRVAIGMEPTRTVEFLNQMIEPLIELKSWSEIRDVIRELKDFDPFDTVSEPVFILGLQKRGLWDLSIAEANELLKGNVLFKNQIVLRSLRAKAYFQLGQLADSANSYREILRLEPNNIIAVSQLGRVLSFMGDFAEARKYLEHAQRIEPHNSHIFRLRTRVYFALKDRVAIEAIISKMEKNEAKLYNTAALRLVEGDYPGVIALLSGPSESTNFLRLRAQAYYSMGRVDRAYQDLLKVVQRSQRPDLFVLLALYRIEKMEISDADFVPSPLLKTLFDVLSPGEWKMFLNLRHREPWLFEADLRHAEVRSDIRNSFWSDEGFKVPINSQAVGELRVRR